MGTARGVVAARRALILCVVVLTGCDEARTMPRDACINVRKRDVAVVSVGLGLAGSAGFLVRRRRPG